MALFRSLWPSESSPAVAGHGVSLRMPQPADFEEWADLRERSRTFLAPWEPTWPDDDLTRSAFRRRLQRYVRDQQADVGYAFLIFRLEDGALVGGATLNNVRRGVSQTASLGYWMGAPYAGQGYMSAALSTLMPFAYGALHLKRVEAACLPHNAASVKLLEKQRFTREGYARRYLCIAGEWQDHLLFARLSTDASA